MSKPASLLETKGYECKDDIPIFNLVPIHEYPECPFVWHSEAQKKCDVSGRQFLFHQDPIYFQIMLWLLCRNVRYGHFLMLVGRDKGTITQL